MTRRSLTSLSCITFFAVNAIGQQAKLQGYVVNDRDIRVPAIRIVAPGGQSDTTDSKGRFTIVFPVSIQPGQATRIEVRKPNWVIYQPMFGDWVTQSKEVNYEPLRVVIVPKGTPLAYQPKRLSAFVVELQKRINRQARTIDTQSAAMSELERRRQTDSFLGDYAEQYGIPVSRLKAALDDWSRIKESDDKLEQALKEYWLGNLERVTQLSDQAGQVYVEKLEQANQERLENSRKAIKAYTLSGFAFFQRHKFREALEAYHKVDQLFETKQISQEEFASEWADLKLSIGNSEAALGLRVAGDEALRFFNQALTEYRKGLQFYSRDQSPEFWAAAQNNIGLVLSDLGRTTGGLAGIDYLNSALAAFHAALEITATRSLEDWALTQNNLGIVFWSLGDRVSGEEGIKYLDLAVTAHRAALKIITQDNSPQLWAALQNNLGNTLAGLGGRVSGQASINYLNDAAVAYEAALRVNTFETSPEDWSSTENNLGNVLLSLGERVSGPVGMKYLQDALKLFSNASQVRSREKLPQPWAQTENNRGIVLMRLAERITGPASVDYLNDAIVAFRAALQIRKREHLAQDWAATQNNLGSALSRLGERAPRQTGIQLLTDGIAAFEAALEVRTREQFPQDWAVTQNNLGTAKLRLGERLEGLDGINRIKEAIDAYHNAVQVRTHQLLPQQWAETQDNLGVALIRLGLSVDGPESIRYLTDAISALRAALTVRTRTELPQQWAETQTNLGAGLRSLALQNGDGTESIKCLTEAAAAYRSAMEVRTRELLPQQWAATMNNLGNVMRNLADRAQGAERIEHLKDAIAVYSAALEVNTREQLPFEWARTESNLGVAYSQLQDWPAAANAFTNVLTVEPDNGPAYGRALLIYQNVLFKFDKAYELSYRWLARHPEDAAARLDFAEKALTTGHFDDAEQRLVSLLSDPALSKADRALVHAIEIPNLVAIGEVSHVPSKMNALIDEITAQPAEFRFLWSFEGLACFLDQNEKTALYRPWLRELFDGLGSGNRDSLLSALRDARSKFKDLSDRSKPLKSD